MTTKTIVILGCVLIKETFDIKTLMKINHRFYKSDINKCLTIISIKFFWNFFKEYSNFLFIIKLVKERKEKL